MNEHNNLLNHPQHLITNHKLGSKSEIKFDNLRNIRVNTLTPHLENKADGDRLNHQVNLRKNKRQSRLSQLRSEKEFDTADDLDCDELTPHQIEALNTFDDQFKQAQPLDSSLKVETAKTEMRKYKHYLNQQTAVIQIIKNKKQVGILELGSKINKTDLVIEFQEILLKIIQKNLNSDDKDVIQFQSMNNILGIIRNCVFYIKNEIHSHKIFLFYIINILIDDMLCEPFFIFNQNTKIIEIIIDAQQKLKRDNMPIEKQSFTKCVSLIAKKMKWSIVDDVISNINSNMTNNIYNTDLFNQQQYKTSVESLVIFNSKTLSNESNDFECKFNIWAAVQDLQLSNHRKFKNNVGLEIDSYFINDLKDIHHKILINRDHLQLTVFLIYLMWNMTADEKHGVKISRRQGGELLQIAMDILLNVNLNRASTAANADLFVSLERSCLNLVANTVQDVQDLSDKLVTFKCNDGLLLQMLIEQQIKSHEMLLRESIFLVMVNLFETGSAPVKKQLYGMFAQKIEIQNVIFNQQDFNTIDMIVCLIKEFIKYQYEMQGQNQFQDYLTQLEEVNFLNQLNNSNWEESRTYDSICKLLEFIKTYK